VDSVRFRPGPRRDPKTIIFAAKLDYFPNAQAAMHLCTEIMPLVWAKHPDARLAIVGNAPPHRLRAQGVDGRIRIVGFVPEMAPWLGSATVAVAPILAKAGMQLKLLEAMACGTPLVASSMAAAGLDARDGKDLLVADGPSEFAGAISTLLGSPPLRERLAAAGRRVAGEYSWEKSVAALERVHVDAAAGHRSGRA